MVVQPRTFVAMSYGDSKAVFKRRSEEIRFEPEVTELIVNHGLDTMAKFAFACNFSPGSADESPLVHLTKEVLKRPATTVEMSCVRRLFSESYANIAADIKNAVESISLGTGAGSPAPGP